MYIIYIILLSYIPYYFSQRMMMRLEKHKTKRQKDRKTERPRDQKTMGALDRYTIIPLYHETVRPRDQMVDVLLIYLNLNNFIKIYLDFALKMIIFA